MKNSRSQKIIDLVSEKGIIRPRDLKQLGIPETYLYRLVGSGDLVRIARGLYTTPGFTFSEHESLAEVCKRVPHGVICLLSALNFHNLTTQLPFQVWMAIHHKTRSPKIDIVPVRIIRMSGASLDEGIEVHKVDKVPVNVFGPAKTVVDCFKYRNKVGLDVALEALRDCWQKRQCTMDELWRFAKICRVTEVIRPYLESLV